MPILYSYRRCPYAMRARMALKIADIDVEIREISLREKPLHMLQASPKATVPVLIFKIGLNNIQVIDESLDIMRWALQQHDPEGMLDTAAGALILENDDNFKQVLDGYKYPERYPKLTQQQYRAQGEVFLQKLESLLSENKYLLKATPSLADIAIFPFIRQFAAVDAAWFEQSDYAKLKAWLKNWVNSDVFKSVMTKNPTFVG